jgi:hypothetical protein
VWLSFYATFDLAGLACCHRLRPLFELATCCGWWWPFEGAVIFTDRPVEIEMNDKKLVRVLYSDGFEVRA